MKNDSKRKIFPDGFLTKQWEALRQERPGVYPREAASLCGVSEREMLPSCTVGDVYDLGSLSVAAVEKISTAEAKWIVRNDFTVLEIFEHASVRKANDRIAVTWPTGSIEFDAAIGCLLVIPEDQAARTSLQWYDARGAMVAKSFYPNDDFLLPLITENMSVDDSAYEDRIQIESAGLPEWLRKNKRFMLGGAFSQAGSSEADLNQVRSLTKIDPELSMLSALMGKETYFVYLNQQLKFFSRHLPRKIMPARGWQNILDPEMNLHLKPEMAAEIQSFEQGGIRWICFCESSETVFPDDKNCTGCKNCACKNKNTIRPNGGLFLIGNVL